MKLLALIGVAAVCASTVAAQGSRPAPAQPLPFSHKVHAGTYKIACKMCHTNPDPGETMGVAAAKACMQCHTSVKADNPSIQKLAAFAKDNRSIPWERVYQIPTYVSFSHRAHTTAGNTCAECHGQVTQRDQLSAEVDLSMTGCMNCHQQKGASVDCSYRHEPR